MKIHVFQHEAFEGLGGMEAWFKSKGHSITYTRFYLGEKSVELQAFDALVVMGGSMGVYDEAIYPWLIEEKLALRLAIEDEKIVLGICLGAQLIASVTGGTVSRNHFKEIGWHEVRRIEGGVWDKIFPATMITFHWHGDTFSLPPGAKHLVGSEACENQAFAIGEKVLGLQFHPEVTVKTIEALMADCENDLTPGPFVQGKEMLRGKAEYFSVNEEFLNRILSRLIG